MRARTASILAAWGDLTCGVPALQWSRLPPTRALLAGQEEGAQVAHGLQASSGPTSAATHL